TSRSPFFFQPSSYPTGPEPAVTLAVDVNGDGRPDLITSDFDDATYPVGQGYVSVLIANADGSFQPHIDYPVGLGPDQMVTADFNRDGATDIVVLNLCGTDSSCLSGVPSTLSILLGNGDGTFQPSIDVSTGNQLYALISDDFNRDSKPDLASIQCSSDCTSAAVILLLGVGDGTFQSPLSIVSGTEPTGIGSGDFNKDQLADLAVTDDLGTVGVLLGNGDGTFKPQVSCPAGMYPLNVRAGDFNNDGSLDLVVADECDDPLCELGDGAISLLVNKGNGTFQAATSYLAPLDVHSLTLGDLNRDGNLDVAAAADGEETTLLGDGQGHLGQHTDYAGVYPANVAVADLNADGILDLGISNVFNSEVAVLHGRGDGVFDAVRVYQAGNVPQTFVVADFNGDGKLDVTVTNEQYDGYGAVGVLLGDGHGGFGNPAFMVAGDYPTGIVTGDFNRDGKLDLIVSNFGLTYTDATLSVFLGNGDGTFRLQPTSLYPNGYYPTELVAGDFNRDGKLDFAVTNQQGGSGQIGNVTVFMGNGDGTFRSGISYLTENTPSGMVQADFNNDGRVDLGVANARSDTISILLGNGDGSFQTHLDTEVYITPYTLATGDFNHDGKPDVAVPSYENQVLVLLGNGDGTFIRSLQSPQVNTPSGIAVGDFNQDGNDDLLVNSFFNQVGEKGGISLILGNGDGTFSLPRYYKAANSGYIVPADLNRDNSLDAIISSGVYGNNGLAVFLNEHGTFLRTSSSQNPSSFGQPVSFTTSVFASYQQSGLLPTGSVRFRDGGTLLATVPLIDGSASYTTSTLSVGSHSIKAEYAGDQNFNRNRTKPLVQTVTP
nr:VCBS repeat-containing protein [Terriglobales bacterium]